MTSYPAGAGAFARRVLAVGVACFLPAATLGCSPRQVDGGAKAKVSKPRPAEVELPDQILGLRVVQEDVSTNIVEVKSATYVSSVALFSLREGELLQASLQVSSFNDLAKPKSERFRRQVASLMGGSSLEELTIGGNKVFMTTGQQQITYTWFKGRGFNVLTVRRAYSFRRTLLRKLLGLAEPV